MNILIDSVSTLNKGAELMIYAVLQELERQHPSANVLLPLYDIPEGVSYFKTTMNCKQRKVPMIAHLFKMIKTSIFFQKFLNISSSYPTDKYPVKKIDLILDAGGFNFSDQQRKSILTIIIWKRYYRIMKKLGTKIIFLPQAFGSFESENGKKQLNIIKNYVDYMIARDEISCSHLIKSGIDVNRTPIYPDFTSLVDGVFPEKYEVFKNGIAIIPNIQMVAKGSMTKNDYIDFLINVINNCRKYEDNIFFLNHEGKKDQLLCEDINNKLHKSLPIINNLNALEIKGIISQCYFVFSSRFHGIVSALSTGVPCLSTGWSHKYKMLYMDYNMEEFVYDPCNTNILFSNIEQLMSIDYRDKISNNLKKRADEIRNINRKMWQQIWYKYKNI